MKSIFVSVIILLGMMNFTCNDFDYKKAWKEVEILMEQRLPKSALEKVEVILVAAKSEENINEQLKALKYISQLTLEVDEEGVESVIYRLDKEMQSAEGVSKAILQSYLGEIYNNYFNQNRWSIANRTNISGGSINQDMKTWTTEDFNAISSKLYHASVENKKALSIPISKFEPLVLNIDKENQNIRPTLYYLLVDRCLTYLKYNSGKIAQPIDNFLFDKEDYLSGYEQFINYEITSSDTLSSEYLTLLLYQDVLKNCKENKHNTALIEYDLQRLEYVWEKSIIENKDEIYFSALERLKADYKDNDFTALVSYKMALYIQKIDTSENGLVNVVNLCDRTVKDYPKTLGASYCIALKSQIQNQSLTLTLDKVNPTKLGILCNVSYTNVSNIYYRIIKAEDIDLTRSRRNKAELNEALRKAKYLKSHSFLLPEKAKYKPQEAEFILSPLPVGEYVLFSSSNDDFKGDFVYNSFQVSNLSMVTFDTENEKIFIVTDRITGEPIKNVEAIISNFEYDRGQRKEISEIIGQYRTDKNGKFTIKKSLDSRYNVSVKLVNGKDKYEMDGRLYLGKGSSPNSRKSAEVFTDRAIYRPGQMVYFKVLALSYNEERIPSILKAEELNISLNDANGQEVSNLVLKTNDFGSASGSFSLPSSGLNGQFSIRIRGANINAYKTISVEEYKRPKFKVEVEKPIGQFVAGDTIKLNINAANYAGVGLDNASITYKVTRNTMYPYWPWYRSYYPNVTPAIIKVGKGKLNKDGDFELTFIAKPDLSQKVENDPQFNYSIEVDVTDINGETQSGQNSISLRYKAYLLQSNLNGKLDKSDLKPLAIKAINNVGSSVDVSGTYKIEKLKEPDHVQLYRKSYGHPMLNSEAEVQKLIPGFLPSFSPNYDTWKVDKMMQAGNFKSDEEVKPEWQKFTAGVYKISAASVDEYGNNILMTDYLIIFDFNKSQFPKADYLFSKKNKSSYQPGDEFELHLGAAEDNTYVYIVQGKNRSINDHGWKTLDPKSVFNYKITEKDLGGSGLSLVIVKNNKITTENIPIEVPWEEKQLKINLETVRDILIPGAKEQWKIKISGSKSDEILAEVLAGMYDASLDAFVKDQWNNSFFPNDISYPNMQYYGYDISWANNYFDHNYGGYSSYTIPILEGFPINYYSRRNMMMERSSPMMDGVMVQKSMAKNAPMPQAAGAMEEMSNNSEADEDISLGSEKSTVQKDKILAPVQLRTNLNETVFFMPHLQTDKDGNVILSFTMNEALTEWKLRVLAHTPQLATAFAEKNVVTQKDLMVFPNVPRFLREYDEIEISTKIANLSSTKINGIAKLKIFDAISDEDISEKFIVSDQDINFFVSHEASGSFTWSIKVPSYKNAIKYQITAQTESHSDGEESIIPIVTNRTLVTEALPIHVKGNSTKNVVFKSLADNRSTTKENHMYTIEVNSHPVWYAIQSLPYLMEYPYECTEQILNKYYANAMASSIANQHPKIKAVFDDWKRNGKSLVSNLIKNQELKSALLEETPWVMEAQSEAEQKKNIALLFDLNKMSTEQDAAIKKIAEKQYPSGGFPWFSGGRENDYITQYVVENLGHLKFLGITTDNVSESVLDKAIEFIDNRLTERYEKLLEDVKKYGGDINADHLDRLSVQYLYARSFFSEKEITISNKAAYNYYLGQAKNYWKVQPLYTTGMIGIALNRLGQKKIASDIEQSLRQRSFYKEDLGRYWNEGNGYRWDQLPIERHSLLIEFFVEMDATTDYIDELKTWLLNNKQTNRWETTKGTSAAIYALLVKGEDQGISSWIIEDQNVEVQLNGKTINSDNVSIEAGTGYYKKSYDKNEFSNKDAKLTLVNKNESIAWVSAYYQYFEDLDKIEGQSDMPLNISKKYFIKVETKNGPFLQEIVDKTVVTIGDRVVVRVIVDCDREMEYIHLKDMRPSGLEPIDVLSTYKWNNGLGYYVNTRDLATHYFIDHMPKGTYVFEYETKVNNKGDFSSGIASIQCMYAPEFTSHSNGERFSVK